MIARIAQNQSTLRLIQFGEFQQDAPSHWVGVTSKLSTKIRLGEEFICIVH